MALITPRVAAALAAVFWTFMVQTPASAATITDLFVFGDSYSDTGAFGHATNGDTAVGYLAKDFGITLATSKNPDPGTDGVNFAESGARVFVGPKPPAVQPRSLTQQVAEFQHDVAANTVKFDPRTSLFFLLGGLNDHKLVTSAQVNAATLAQVTTLYGLGARLFEIALLPSKVPWFTDSAANLNPGFSALVPKLREKFPDAVFGLSDWGPDYDDILENPSKYGMTNVTDACRDDPRLWGRTCSAPARYFYYYLGHPSDAAHHIVGNELYAEVLRLPPVPRPPAFSGGDADRTTATAPGRSASRRLTNAAQ
jgi:cholinesterase